MCCSVNLSACYLKNRISIKQAGVFDHYDLLITKNPPGGGGHLTLKWVGVLAPNPGSKELIFWQKKEAKELQFVNKF